MPSSDIDILCHAPDADRFVATLWRHFSAFERFAVHQWTAADRPVIATFVVSGWPVEIFGQARPVAEQAGWRHFRVEQRLLALGGDRFRAAVLAGRRTGQKTEPAFAAALGLAGDPYEALLEIETGPDDRLRALLTRAGF